MYVMTSKIEATIGQVGDMIGWEDDNETVGPIALAAKQSLLNAIPHIMPPEGSSPYLYRFVLEHGDFGIHNATVKINSDGTPTATSIFDWETACIWPALLSDPELAVFPVDLQTNAEGSAAIARIPEAAQTTEVDLYQSWAQHYNDVSLLILCHPVLTQVHTTGTIQRCT